MNCKAQIALESLVALTAFLMIVALLLGVYVDALQEIEDKNLKNVMSVEWTDAYNNVSESFGLGREHSITTNQDSPYRRWFPS